MNEQSESFTVPKQSRWDYGPFETLASSNPAYKGSYVNLQPAGSPSFRAIYKEKIAPEMVTAIYSIFPDGPIVVNVLRTGPTDEISLNPIVIQVVIMGLVEDSDSQGKANDLVAKITNIIEHAQWEGEDVRVDVCRSSQSSLEASNVSEASDVCRSSQSSLEASDVSEASDFDLLEFNMNLYDSESPLPGSSLGPRDGSRAGTLTGYIECVSGDVKKIFTLTCDHVARALDWGAGPYLYTIGQEKQLITSPAPLDHLAAINSISGKIERCEKSIACLEDQLRKNIFVSEKAQKRITGYINRERGNIARWQQVKSDAEGYVIDFGSVFATSGTDDEQPSRKWGGRLDWAMITVPDNTIAENKHLALNSEDRGSGFPLNKPAGPFNQQFIQKARLHFDPGPKFKAIRERALELNELVLKPTSRSTGWVVGRYNDIESLHLPGFNRITWEWSILALDKMATPYALGDSGSVMLDQDFHPVAILWCILCMWKTGHIAYVTPITEVLRDIENRLGWEKGSVSFC